MTTPTTPEPAGSPDAKQSETTPPRARPAGETGGHTVQDWEHGASSASGARTALQEPKVQPVSAPEEAEPTAPATPPNELEGADEPNPPTTPLYLRPIPQEMAPAKDPPAQPFDARAATLTAQSAALVDSLTRGLAEAFAVALRPAVASTVDALIPMILSLGSVPDDAEPEAAVEAGVEPSAD